MWGVRGAVCVELRGVFGVCVCGGCVWGEGCIGCGLSGVCELCVLCGVHGAVWGVCMELCDVMCGAVCEAYARYIWLMCFINYICSYINTEQRSI